MNIGAFLQPIMNTPFQWGHHDCATLVGEWLTCCGKPGMMDDFPGYRTAIGAQRAITRAGAKDLADLVWLLDHPTLDRRALGLALEAAADTAPDEVDRIRAVWAGPSWWIHRGALDRWAAFCGQGERQVPPDLSDVVGRIRQGLGTI